MSISFKKLALSICLFGLTSAVWADIEKVTQQQGIQEYRLENGLRVLLAPNEKETKVMLDVLYFTGSLNDPKHKSGLAHLLEHLAFKGTKNIVGDEFQRRLDKYTLRANAVTNHYATRYLNVIRPDSNAISQVLLLEAERMNNLVLKKEYVAPEIEIVKREREVRMDKAPALMVDWLLKNIYGYQSLGRMPIGSLDELQSIQLPEIEQYYQTWYVPNNAVVILTGKFDQKDVLKQIEQAFSALPSKPLPKLEEPPKLDINKVSEKTFTVQKGRDYSTQLIYVANPNKDTQRALSFVPYLYSSQPTGKLYKNMVMNGEANSVNASTWLTKDFNIVYMGANYSHQAQTKNMTAYLIQQSEQPTQFDQIQLKRAKNQMKNAHEQMMVDSSAMSSMLGGVLIQENGNWIEYFNQYKALQSVSLKDVNRELKSFFNSNKRLITYIQPTVYTPQQQTQNLLPNETQFQAHIPVIPIWDKKDFIRSEQELKKLQQHSTARLVDLDQQIQRGQLKNGMKYAIFATSTADNMTYATITINFGAEKSLAGQGAILELMNSLLLKGTKKYSYEQIIDRSTQLQGKANSTIENNQLKIDLQAPKEHFTDYLSLVSELIQNANFDQSEFDVLKKQRLAHLQQHFTEPKFVSEIQMGRLLEKYKPEDIRYHFEPKSLYVEYKNATQPQLKKMHQQFIGMDHAEIAITGEVNQEKIKKLIQDQFESWNTQTAYTRMGEAFFQYPAKHLHVQSEPREFGSYQGFLNFPVGAEHVDAASMLIFSQVLGNSQLSSRLALELREKNALVYSFSSRLNLDAFDQVGSLKILADYSTVRSSEISKAVKKTLSDLVKTGLTQQEVETAKLEIMKQRVAAMDDTNRVHRLLNSQLERDLKMNSRNIRDSEIISLTADDVNRAIKRYIDPNKMVEVRADQFGQVQGL